LHRTRRLLPKLGQVAFLHETSAAWSEGAEWLAAPTTALVESLHVNRGRIVLGLVSEVKSNPAQTRSQEMSSLHSGRNAGPGTYNLHFFLEAPSNRD